MNIRAGDLALVPLPALQGPEFDPRYPAPKKEHYGMSLKSKKQIHRYMIFRCKYIFSPFQV